ncbi:MAG: hypothetical protein A2719_04005 [Candidatus Ryanbacteria bacterium RIFCSPHIGHO2_01_FULL_45_22]|uniref:Uncharacterized protein n=1 Tax=Candidatus Ryanbacteria bacterium RIFCSPHIGHO2_01_FULL_45_22 TaxID=1802114 RepID=A0A1G2G3F4_9BACT|nr:MAG: hypothetical protein A2719_04005 [Candidatus Ryanbacteria bacterium RIFCSPHIGHO2_01_FULL_45_22]
MYQLHAASSPRAGLACVFCVWDDSGHPVYAITPCGDAEMVCMALVITPGFNYADLRFVLDVEFIRMFAIINGIYLDALQKKYEAWHLKK